ncbi:unnamed protein product [Caenorhabditis angaria]|uniref:Calponin-homology (CH) domain-containing protein n=1 Tax=Caenorhabditis angaria TaxID=860376 RepID=A0A9P1N8R6_9PELO|nr:unnamed protein product [Caenorhabditis angaria]
MGRRICALLFMSTSFGFISAWFGATTFDHINMKIDNFRDSYQLLSNDIHQHFSKLSTFLNASLDSEHKHPELEINHESKDMNAIFRKIRSLMKFEHKTDTSTHFEKEIKGLRKLLSDSKLDEKIENLLSKRLVMCKSDFCINVNIGLQNVLLHILLSFHQTRLLIGLEAIFKKKIDNVIHFIVNNVFKTTSKKPANIHFLSTIIKLLFLIGKSVELNLIPTLTRMFNKSSEYREFDGILNDLSKEILAGSSITFKKALVRLGFDFNFIQSFIDDYDYTISGFRSFSNGLVFARLVEQFKKGTIKWYAIQQPKTRLRKLKNVEIVLESLENLNFKYDAVKIVQGDEKTILRTIWKILNIQEVYTETPQNLRHYLSFDEQMLRKCQFYGEKLNVDVPSLESLLDGELFAKAWKTMAFTHHTIEFSTVPIDRFIEIILLKYLGIDRKLAIYIGLFIQAYFGKLEILNELQKHVNKN